MTIPIIGDVIEGVSSVAKEYFRGKKESTKARVKGKIEEVQAKTEQRVTQLVEEGESVRKAIEAEAGTKRAIIAKNMRFMRRLTLIVLLAPFLAGALIIAGEYVIVLFTGAPARPDFTPLELFWDEVVGGAKEWWVVALQGAFTFLWAGGEITSVGAQAGGAVLDSLERGRESKERQRREERLAERERANRERESRGEERLPDDPEKDTEDDPIVRPGPSRGRGR